MSFCKNLQIFKKWLNFLQRCAGQAKHVFSLPEDGVLTVAGLCSWANTCLSFQELRKTGPRDVCTESERLKPSVAGN